MRNIVDIDGHKALVSFDPELEMLRGEFLGLSGGADFYAESVDGLLVEGRKSLEVYLEMCREKSIEPFKAFSGRFNVRLNPALHEAAVVAAAAESKSLNDWVSEAIEYASQRN
jgi:predicted HicB family RNase H-like nuclease